MLSFVQIPEQSGMRILVVEDHPIYFEGVQSILKRLDDTVDLVSADTAESALRLCESDQRFDLCVVDLMLPGIDGASFVEALVAREIWIPTVVISADDDAEKISRALSGGALGFIPKSASAEEMLTSIQSVLKGDLVIPDAVNERLHRADRAAKLDVPEKVSRLGITPRQYRVLELMAAGMSNAQIAQTMNVSEHTVKSHVRALFQAFEVQNRTACVHCAVRAGLVPPPRVLRDVS